MSGITSQTGHSQQNETMTGKFVPRKFRGGTHPWEGKTLSDGKEVKVAPLFDKYTVPLLQNIGKPPKLCVAPGDSVKRGQVLAVADGFVSTPIHSPTSGTVGNLVMIPGFTGVPVQAIEILSDGKDEWGTGLQPITDWRSVSVKTLKQRISDAGIVGMGGASFPTIVKLSPPAEKTIDTLILNGAECEPYLTADHRLMVERAEQVLDGIEIGIRILDLSEAYIGIEENKPDAIEVIRAAVERNGYNIHVIPLKTRYPQGSEKQLIYTVTGRTVVCGGLPMDVGCIVQNVGTTAAMREAVVEGHPLTERLTTITGTPIQDPRTWQLRIGTPISKAIEIAGGVVSPVAKVLLGGPMMGFSQPSLDVCITKNTSGVLLLAPDEIEMYTSQPCIRCGRCVDVCPMQLHPGPLSVLIEAEQYDLADDNFVMNCIECGACAYVCPARRPLVQHFRRAKAEINAKQRAVKH